MDASLVWNYNSSRPSDSGHFFSFLSHVLACRVGRALINHTSLFFSLRTVQPSLFIELQVKRLFSVVNQVDQRDKVCCVSRSSVPVLHHTHFSMRRFKVRFRQMTFLNIPLEQMHPNAPVLLSWTATAGPSSTTCYRFRDGCIFSIQLGG